VPAASYRRRRETSGFGVFSQFKTPSISRNITFISTEPDLSEPLFCSFYASSSSDYSGRAWGYVAMIEVAGVMGRALLLVWSGSLRRLNELI
jgi:hypothetical protein